MTAASDRSPETPEPTVVDDSYWSNARRPRYILAFLTLPIVVYELSLALLLQDEPGLHVNTVEAHRGLLRFFATFGVTPTGGLYLGGVAIMLVLLVWHLLVRDRWRVEPRVLPLMALETLGLTVPLLVFSHLVASRAVEVAAPTGPVFADLDIWSQMAISVGAGLYEELAFRMILIALIHTLLVDIARAPGAVGTVISIGLSAIAFTLYHDLRLPGGSVSSQKVAFYFGAGLYLGAVYVLRGFGLAVGVHALYDITTVLITGVD